MSPDISNLYPILSRWDFQGVQKKSDKIVKKFIAIWEDVLIERRKQESAILGQRDFVDALIKDGYTNVQINQLIMVRSLSLYLLHTHRISSLSHTILFHIILSAKIYP